MNDLIQRIDHFLCCFYGEKGNTCFNIYGSTAFRYYF